MRATTPSLLYYVRRAVGVVTTTLVSPSVPCASLLLLHRLAIYELLPAYLVHLSSVRDRAKTTGRNERQAPAGSASLQQLQTPWRSTNRVRPWW